MKLEKHVISSFLRLSFGSFVAKLLGLFREVLFAAWFGTTEVAAAFRIAQSLFFIPIHSLVGDTLAGALLPLYQQARNESTHKARFISNIAIIQGLLLGLVLGVLMFTYSREIVLLLAPGASEATVGLAERLLTLMSPAVPVYIIGNTFAYLETAHSRYTALSSRSALANVGIIIAGFFAYSYEIPEILGIGFAGVYVLFLILTLYDLIACGLLGQIVGGGRPFHWALAAKFERGIFSLIGVLFISQMNVFAERSIASALGTSVIPALDYARFLTETITVLLAVPLSIVALSTLGGASVEFLRSNCKSVANVIVLLTAPASALFFINAEDIVRLIYQRGAFEEESVELTASILKGLAVGLVPSVLSYFLLKTLNAARLNRAALAFTGVACAGNVLFNLIVAPIIGPLALGIGNGVYGIMFALLALRRIGVLADFFPSILVNCGSSLLATLIALMLPRLTGTIPNIVLDFFVVGVGFCFACLVYGPNRVFVRTLITKLSTRKLS